MININLASQNAIGFAYEHGEHVEKSEEEAFRWYMIAATNDYSGNFFRVIFILTNLFLVACVNVGLCYEGKFFWKILRNLLKNIRKFIKNLDGLGTDRNGDEAFRWCMKGAERGNAGNVTIN